MATPTTETIRVLGYREFQRAIAAMPREIQKDVREALRAAGEAVRRDAAGKTSSIGSDRSAAGYRTVVRQRGIAVEQSLRKTTGLRGDWGSTQMKKSLIPALHEKEPETELLMEKAMKEVVDFFELRARWQASGLLPD